MGRDEMKTSLNDAAEDSDRLLPSSKSKDTYGGIGSPDASKARDGRSPWDKFEDTDWTLPGSPRPLKL